MVIIIVVALVSIISLSWLGWFARRELERRRLKRMSDNAYNTALTLWNFARVIKDQLDEVGRGRAEVIDFTNISVPAGTGYNVCLELAGYGFRLHAVPERYDRTGRISLYVDNALTVRAWDRGGENATAEDPEYTGDDPTIAPAAPSPGDLTAHEDQTHQSKDLPSGNATSERIIVKSDKIEASRTRAHQRPKPPKAVPVKGDAIKPEVINPGAMKGDSVDRDPIEGESIKPGIKSDSVRGYSVRRDPIKSDRIKPNPRDRIT
jgi:hypothetical protein